MNKQAVTHCRYRAWAWVKENALFIVSLIPPLISTYLLRETHKVLPDNPVVIILGFVPILMQLLMSAVVYRVKDKPTQLFIIVTSYFGTGV